MDPDSDTEEHVVISDAEYRRLQCVQAALAKVIEEEPGKPTNWKYNGYEIREIARDALKDYAHVPSQAPLFRCGNCDDRVETEWKYCPWCGGGADWKPTSAALCGGEREAKLSG